MAQNEQAGEYIEIRYAGFAWAVTVMTVKVTVIVTVRVVDCGLTSD